jgi:predicted Rossmann fold flavoprotein
MKKVVVIGAGAAGLVAAGFAAKNAEVLIIEKNDRVGRKLAITGKGRCNITNSADISDFIENIPGNGRFLYSALYSFTNDDVIEFFNKLGVKTKVERGGRVFPVSDSAKDVVNALYKFNKDNNVKIRYGTSVKEILTDNDKVTGVRLDNNEVISCDKVILATGGKSYPATGSTGDGYEIAKKLGHKIVSPKPSLVGLISDDEWISELQGLSLKNVEFSLMDSRGKQIYSEFGEMLFTHFGVSGPIVLSGSRVLHKYMNDNRKVNGINAKIDLKPALDFKKLDLRVQRDFEKYINKELKNALFELLPERLIPIVIKLSNIDEHKKVNVITAEERKRMVEVLKNLEFSIDELRPIDEAIITAGGVCVDEINPSTMESKNIQGLYFCGEVIDVDAYTGGFNLQIAFSTAFLAGNNI